MTESSAALTPVMKQYREAKQQHPDGILLFRLGEFVRPSERIKRAFSH